MGKYYKINPTYPYCGEEHLYWKIQLTDEEQEILDVHTKEHESEHPVISLLSQPGLYVERKLKCGICYTEFSVKAAVRKENEIGWSHPDFVPLGEVPVL